MSSGERDLAAILTTMDVVRRPGVFAYVELPTGSTPPPTTVAMVDEGVMTSFVVDADADGADGTDFRAAWLTITVRTALDGVGLTAALATALAAADIPANVLAGLAHDHLLVPEHAADRAIEVLRDLGGRS